MDEIILQFIFIVVIPDFDITSYANLVKSIEPCSLSYSLKEIEIEILGFGSLMELISGIIRACRLLWEDV